MKKLKHILSSSFYSLPVQLLVIQIRKYKLLLIFWLLLLGILSGTIGDSLGLGYLFLEPEYLGKENFWSFFIVGATLGTFFFAYMITIYINESYRFHFIALNRHPFVIFSLNNALLPGLMLSIYLYRFTEFHLYTNGFTAEVAEKVAGLFMGMFTTFVLFASYFFATGKNSILRTLGDNLEREIEKARGGKNRRIILGKARASYRTQHRVDYFLRSPLKIEAVDKLTPIDFRQVVQALNKNHGNLLLLQIGTFLLIGVLGLMEHNPHFQVPAGASIMLMLALILMIAGAITFWFRKLGVIPMLVFAVFIYLYDSTDWLHEQNHAYGLDYQQDPACLDRKTLAELSDEAQYEADRVYTLQMLENWRQHYQQTYGYHQRPKAVIVSSSGGGLRSSFWTFSILQQLDSLTEGIFSDNIRLYTGASGGTIGSAYFRELYARRKAGEVIPLHSSTYRQNLSQDLLNRISFRVFTDIFLPNRKVEVNGKKYDKERGFSFDQQLVQNLPEFAGRKLGHYRDAEFKGHVPPLVLTPTITNHSRPLYITSSPASFLSRSHRISDRYYSKAHGVEFRRMFKAHEADSLLMSTALRMNATFPFVLPVVELPTEPPMLVMDAGAIDNYGTQSAIKYLYEFREWFAANTDMVLFVQLRDNSREDPIGDPSKQGFFSRLLTPLGGGYNS
ncbi:MAG: hypothetical protein AAGI38_18110, partial [Bacteroidota bacterium]